MTNCPFGGIENYRDLESINAYYELTEAGLREPEELLECIAYKSRDNARTPVQWDDSPNGGFTTGQPWIMVNPNYVTINAKDQLLDPDSVFHYYQKLIWLRRKSKWASLIVYGTYDLLAPEDENIFAYTRQLGERKLLVVCNLSAEEQSFTVPDSIQWNDTEQLIGTIGISALTREMSLAPWQADVWEL